MPCLDLRQKVTHSEIHLLINIDVPNMTCQIGDEYKLFLIIQRIIEQHKFTVVYLASFVVINCCIPDVSCQSNTLKSSVMNSLPAAGSLPVLQWRLLNSLPLLYLGLFCKFQWQYCWTCCIMVVALAWDPCLVIFGFVLRFFFFFFKLDYITLQLQILQGYWHCLDMVSVAGLQKWLVQLCLSRSIFSINMIL